MSQSEYSHNNWKVVFTKQAQKDAKKISESNLREKTEGILNILRESPYKNSPSYEKLIGDLKGAYSRRINIQDRVVYQILDDYKTIKVLKLWTHYE